MSGRRIITIALLIGAVIFSGCSQTEGEPPDISNFTGRSRHTTVAFGTVSVLRLYEDFSRDVNVARFDRVWEETRELLRELDAVFSTRSPDSDVSRFNALEYGESIHISAHMARVVRESYELFIETGGLFDPTVYPLVDLWGFTPRFSGGPFRPLMPYDRPGGRGDIPCPLYIEAFLQLVNFEKIVLGGDAENGYTLTKRIPPVTVNGTTYQGQLSFGAIVKGYATELVREIMLREGFAFGHFSCGGSSMSILKGMDHTDPYQFDLRLRKPRPGENNDSAFISLRVGNMCLSTSGDYDHVFFIDDVRYSHIFNAATGWPVNTPADGPQSGLAAATIFGADGARLEAVSTAILSMPLAEAIAFLNMRPELKAVLVYYNNAFDHYEVITNFADYLITILDPAYVLASRLDDHGHIVYEGVLGN